MVDRVALLSELEPRSKLNARQAEELRKTLDKAVVGLTLALPLNAAQALPNGTRAELEIVVRDSLTPKDAEKLSKLWEPSRKLDIDTKPSLKRDLIDLLHGRRGIYVAPKMSNLEEARKLKRADRIMLRTSIERLAPLTDLKGLVKAWDKHLFPKPNTRRAHTERLLSLLNGAEPTSPPAVKTSKARKSKSE
jgi:hypothetical protein